MTCQECGSAWKTFVHGDKTILCWDCMPKEPRQSCCGYPLTPEGKCSVSGQRMIQPGVRLTEEEVSELSRFFQREYLNPNTFPALVALMQRIGQ